MKPAVSSDGESIASQPGARVVLAMAFACAGLCGYSSITVPALGTTLEGELGISHTLLGVILSGYFAGSILASVFLAARIHGTRLKRLGMASLFLLALSNLVSVVPGVAWLWAGRAILGMATTSTIMFAGSVITGIFPDAKSRLISFLHGMLVAGGCVAMAVTLPLAERLGGWPLVFGTSIGLALVAAMVMAMTPCRLSAEPQAFDRAAVRRVMRHPAMLVATLVLFFYIVFEAGVTGFFAAYAEQELGIGRVGAARIVAWFLGGIVTGRFLMAVLPEARKSLGYVTAGLTIAGAACIVAALYMRGSEVLCLALLAGGLVGGPVAPLGISYAVDRIGHSQNGILAVTNIILNAGGMAGPVLTGFIGEHFSLGRSLLWGTLAFMLSAVPLAVLAGIKLDRAEPNDRLEHR